MIDEEVLLEQLVAIFQHDSGLLCHLLLKTAAMGFVQLAYLTTMPFVFVKGQVCLINDSLQLIAFYEFLEVIEGVLPQLAYLLLFKLLARVSSNSVFLYPSFLALLPHVLECGLHTERYL